MRLIFSMATCALLLTTAHPGFAGDVVSSGQFKGASNHKTTGAASVEKSAAGTMVVLGADFNFDGAPDPKVGFGRDGVYDAAAQLQALKSKTGHQEYNVPGSVDLARYNEIYIWCEQYNVPLGVAKLK